MAPAERQLQIRLDAQRCYQLFSSIVFGLLLSYSYFIRFLFLLQLDFIFCIPDFNDIFLG